MVPSAFVALASLPLTPNGKVDRGALPVPGLAAAEVAAEFVAPRTEFERTIVEIWRAVLGVDRVGLHDDFFQLGGHSLLGTQLMSRVREVFRVDLPLRVLFEAPTVADLGAAIACLQANEEAKDRAEIQRMIEGFSDDEIERELARRAGASGDGHGA